MGRPPRADHVPDVRPTRTRRTTRSRPARATPPTSRRPGSTRPRRTGAPRSTSRSSGRTTSTSTTATRAIGGPENLLLRQAISQAIDREAINEAVYNGTRTVVDGHHACRASPGSRRTSASTAPTTPKAAQAAFDEWTAAGNAQAEPLPIQFNADAGHEDVVADHHRQPRGHRHRGRGRPACRRRRTSPRWPTGGCVFCRSGWYADYPTYDNFMYDLFHTDSLGGNNYGFINAEFDALVDEAKQTVDPTTQGDAVQPGRGDPAQRRTSARPDQLVPAATTPTTTRRSATSRRPTSA